MWRPRLLLTAVTLLSAASAQTLLIRNATIIDPTGASPIKGSIVILGSKISSVGPVVRSPAKAKLVNATGKYVIPGLWDMHVHLCESQPMFNLYTANGVVAVRDMGSNYSRTRKWAAEALARTGPRVFTSGEPVDGPGARAGKFPVVRVSTPEEGRRAADSLDTQGVDFINVLSTVSGDAYRALAERVRLRRATFAGHVPESIAVIEAINARQRSMEHLLGLALACSSEELDLRMRRADAIAAGDAGKIREVNDRAYKTFDEIKATLLFRRMRLYSVWQTPTLIRWRRLASDPRTKYVPRAVREAWKDPVEEARQEDYEFHCKLVGLMRRHDVEILAGTDTGDPFVLPGFALHDELALLVQAGLTPLEAIQSATVNAARYFGLDATHGTIQRGKSADLVILDADPLADIRNTQRIAAVVVRGKLLDRKQLDRILSE